MARCAFRRRGFESIIRKAFIGRLAFFVPQITDAGVRKEKSHAVSPRIPNCFVDVVRLIEEVLFRAEIEIIEHYVPLGRC